MAGNAWEWCLDVYDADFYAVSDDSRNPIAGGETIQWLRENFRTLPNDLSRVLRGGGWFYLAQDLRVADRFRFTPPFEFTFVSEGFRCVREITHAPAGADIPEADGVDEGEVAGEEVPADDIADDVGIEVLEGMVLIPGGSFLMGSEDAEAQADEQPVHTVHLDAFYMDTHEVTNAEFKIFVDANPAWGKDNIEKRFHDGYYLHHWTGNDYPAGKADYAVVFVSWYAAMAYAEWAGKRLPTEAELEYAARGGLAGKKYPWGDTTSAPVYDGWDIGYEFDQDYSGPVGRGEANGYGLYDMAGNVFEWGLDAYDEDFYAVSDNSRNPIAGGETVQGLRENFKSIPPVYRVLRGSSWDDYAEALRVANRFRDVPLTAFGLHGFRCVKDVAR